MTIGLNADIIRCVAQVLASGAVQVKRQFIRAGGGLAKAANGAATAAGRECGCQ